MKWINDMKVSDLIQILQTMPPDARIYHEYGDCCSAAERPIENIQGPYKIKYTRKQKVVLG